MRLPQKCLIDQNGNATRLGKHKNTFIAKHALYVIDQDDVTWCEGVIAVIL